MIYLMTGDAALAVAGEWLPMLERAIDDADGRWSADELLADVAASRVLVWIVSRETNVIGVFTTRVMQSRITWVLIEDLAGDDLHEWMLQAMHAVETWARELGAKQLMFEGRRGWSRLLRGYGFETTRITGVKRLEVLQ